MFSLQYDSPNFYYKVGDRVEDRSKVRRSGEVILFFLNNNELYLTILLDGLSSKITEPASLWRFEIPF